ncbi:MAG: DUF116 domain-containing protein [Syntrophobacterales bacterium]|jgi:hypothetical protein|nr:DUF116 domain-containing protein [Syntrophobacterales bacterium]
MKEPVEDSVFKDRKLGNEWADWDVLSDFHEHEIEEHSATFLALAVLTSIVLIGFAFAAWYMIRPRMEQFSAMLPRMVEWAMGLFVTCLLAALAIEVLVLRRGGRSFFPQKPIERLFLLILPKALWLGGCFGISRDRVGNSFIKVHNYIMTTHADRLSTERLLMLLPRCLEKTARSEIMSRSKEYEMHVITAGGGEEARRAIRQYRPTLILAVACERDLVSGIKDVSEKAPVLAIPNKRPEGPCKNTCLQIDKFEEILHFIRAQERGARGAATP